MRLVLETDDIDAALAFYRDALGLPVQEAYEAEGDARVVILGIPSATLEIANRSQIDYIDRVEVGRPAAHAYPLTMRVALEVADAGAATDAAVAGGAQLVAPPTETPWRSLNARLEGPDGVALTLFQELEQSEGDGA
ncbi:VOC family protein [Protaetiibacter sp. SSC-01]|nr:VOC family protein [Protaetiibacter sp. SSC-01]